MWQCCLLLFAKVLIQHPDRSAWPHPLSSRPPRPAKEGHKGGEGDAENAEHELEDVGEESEWECDDGDEVEPNCVPEYARVRRSCISRARSSIVATTGVQ